MSKLKSLDKLFDGRHFDREIILLCVRWYLRYKLSLRDLVEMMAERGLSLAHTTILRWVQRVCANRCPVLRRHAWATKGFASGQTPGGTCLRRPAQATELA
jgi:transposase-like protein